MWEKAIERQYNLFGILLILLVTALSIVGALLSNAGVTLTISQKILFSSASLVLFIVVVILIRMAHIERKIAFKIEPPKSSGDINLQNEENRLRLLVNISLPLALGLSLLFINLVVWRLDLQIILK